MKSKFTSVVRVKKQEMDKLEAKLVVARLNVRSAEENLALLRARLDEFSLPKSGNIDELRQNLELINIARQELSACKERLEIAKKEVLHYEHKYKNANLEYEKMRYLEKEEFKREIKRIQKAEALALDEFAVMKFAGKSEV